MAGKKQIVIVGGGAGAALARRISAKLDSSKHDLTVISPLPYSIWLPATLRMLVDSKSDLDKSSGALIPLDKLAAPGKPGKFLQGTVKSVQEKNVTLENGETVPFDYLVVATGASWTGVTAFPYSNTEVRSHISDWRSKISSAKSVVISGGGAVGIELAGEIKHHYPSTNVTLVHSGSLLLNAAYPDSFRDKTAARARAAGITVVLDDRVDIPAEGATNTRLVSKKGKSFEADLFIPAVGARPNTALLRSLSGAVFSETGHVGVAKSLNVKNGASFYPHIYALGDIIDWDEQHQTAKTPAHHAVVEANLLASLKADEKGTPLAKPPAEYKGFMEVIIVPLGPEGGVGYLPLLWGISLGNWATKKMKAAALFLPQARTALGY